MLVLSRKTHERILIRIADMEVWVSVEKVHGDKVSLGVDAPPDVEILREEIVP
jgi:carbon storage regulator